MTATLSASAVVGILRRAGLSAADRSTGRPGYAVRRLARGEVAVLGDSMTDAAWLTAMSALEVAGLTFTYRCDEGRGSRVSR